MKDRAVMPEDKTQNNTSPRNNGGSVPLQSQSAQDKRWRRWLIGFSIGGILLWLILRFGFFSSGMDLLQIGFLIGLAFLLFCGSITLMVIEVRRLKRLKKELRRAERKKRRKA